MEPVERYVVEELFAELDRPEFLAALASDEHAVRRDELTRALLGIDGQRATLAQMWGAGDMTTDEWQAARGGLDARESALRAELAAMPATPAKLAGIDGAREAWPMMTLGERREFLRLFIDRIKIHRARPGNRFDPNRIEITWRKV
jgi:hypothetical protein